MKKLIMTLLSFGACSTFAMTVVDLNGSHHYTCNGVQITPNTTISTLQNNCSNVQVILHEEPSARAPVRIPGGGAEMTMIAPVDPNDETMMDKVEFYTDRGSYMKCFYTNNTFVKCKRNPPSKSFVPKANASSTSVKKKVTASTSK